MNAKRYLIVTPEYIQRGNIRCLGRMVLYGLGSLSVFLVLFLFGWLLSGFLMNNRPLNWPSTFFALSFSGGFFYFGSRYLRKHGPQNWERIAQKSESRLGKRIARRGDFHYVQMGEAVIALCLAGPDWLARVCQEFRNLIKPTPEKSHSLEALRQHLAAREGWVPLRHFESHHKEIQELISLGLVSVREMLGEWHLHVTLEGTVKRPEK